jgi:hypothetical protein
VGPPSEYPGSAPRQATSCCRERRCLLKGCERPFQPRHPLARYCSDACRQAARRWTQWKANQRYRASDHGRCRRRGQSYRHRVRAAQQCREDSTDKPQREGYQEAPAFGEFCCDRPGCYECFDRSRRSPLQRFCSALCRQALQRVLQREARWRRRRARRPISVRRQANGRAP